ncbi:MAG: hypothetical protein M3P08_17470 [Thermoproteota archaeon]|nr:hypothetical protein [Thermoproteota archaeon]
MTPTSNDDDGFVYLFKLAEVEDGYELRIYSSVEYAVGMGRPLSDAERGYLVIRSNY